jgi:hypothetical protein
VSAAVLSSASAFAQDTCATAYESAQELRRGRELMRARADLRLCERSCPKKLADDCSGWRRDVEAELASVVLDARAPEGLALARVRVSVDGSPLVDVVPAEAMELDPGPHVLVFEDEAGARTQVEVALTRGEKRRIVSVRLPRPTPPAPPPTAPPSAAPQPPPPAHSAHTPAPYLLGGLGLAALTVGAILGVKGQIERSSLEIACAPTCNKAAQVDPITAEWWAGAAAAIAGGTLLGGGVVLWAVEERSGKRPAGVTLLPGPGWLSVRGTF